MNVFTCKRLLLILVSFLSAILAFSTPGEIATDPEQAREIAKEAYTFAYPMLENYRTMTMQIAVFGEMNKFDHGTQLVDPGDRRVVRPNNDTLYSRLWLDLRTEPFVVSVPEIDDRYYSFQMIDIFTHNFAYVGSRVTGTNPVTFMITGPKWEGDIPGGVDKVFKSESNFVFALGRTAVNSELPGDLEKVLEIQNQYIARSLSEYLEIQAPEAKGYEGFPPYSAEQAISAGFIEYFNFLLSELVIHPTEVSLIERFGLIGIAPGESFDAQELDPQIRAAIEDGISDALDEIISSVETIDRVENGWTLPGSLFGNRTRMQGNYFARAVGAYSGLYAVDLEEAFYPSCFVDSYGEYPDASEHNYVLWFSAESIPPVEPLGFWSITMYDVDQYLIKNPINRYSIGDRSNLSFNEDGSLTIYIQHESPGASREPNWLPAPSGCFSVMLRMYLPSPEALDPLYCPPPLQKSTSID